MTKSADTLPLAGPPSRRWAPNPFALAELALGRQLDSRDPGSINKSIYEAFGIEALAALSLDPDSLLGVLSARQASRERPTSIAEALLDVARQELPSREIDALLAAGKSLDLPEAVKWLILWGERNPNRVSRALGAFVEHDPTLLKLARTLPSLLGVPLRAEGPGSNEGMPRLSEIDARGVQNNREPGPPIRDVSYLDPVQGLTWDCWLLAGFSAFAWAYTTDWRRHVERCCRPPAGGAFGWIVFDQASPRKVAVTTRFLVATVDQHQVPVGATSADEGELWPSLAEKAFASRLLDGEPRIEDYQDIENQMPGSSLPDMFSVPRNRTLSVSPARFCQTPLAGHSNRLVEVTDATVAISSEKEKMPARLRPVITPNHAYTVLGRFQMEKSYVVLRDPYGARTDHLRAPASLPSVVDRQGREVQLGQGGVFACPDEVFKSAFAELAVLPR
jgi:hypothetical protein